MLLRSRVRAASESAMPDSSTRDVRDDTDDDGSSECVVRGAVESGWMWILPERDDDDLSRVHVGDGSTVAEARKDGEHGSDVGVRHERRRDSRIGYCVDGSDAGELQPGESDDTSECVVWDDIDVG